MLTAAYCPRAARRSPVSTPAATTWSRSCEAIIPVPASRSAPPWCSPIAPRWRLRRSNAPSLAVLLRLNRLPDAIGRARRVDVADAVDRQRIDDGVDAG